MSKKQDKDRIVKFCERIRAATPETRAEMLKILDKFIPECDDRNVAGFAIEFRQIVLDLIRAERDKWR